MNRTQSNLYKALCQNLSSLASMSGESGTHFTAPQDSLGAAHSNGSPNPNPFKQVYELGREIGKGGFGSVHIGSCLKSGDEFAIKVIIRR